jgi:hypothetical protein
VSAGEGVGTGDAGGVVGAAEGDGAALTTGVGAGVGDGGGDGGAVEQAAVSSRVAGRSRMVGRTFECPRVNWLTIPDLTRSLTDWWRTVTRHPTVRRHGQWSNAGGSKGWVPW